MSDPSNIIKLRARNRAVRNGDFRYEDREWMRERYDDRKMDFRQIAIEANCGLRTIARWMKAHGIERRSHKEGIDASGYKQPSGVDSPRWSGKTVCAICKRDKAHQSRLCRSCSGKARTVVGDIPSMVRQWCYDYWRPKVFERDGYACQDCGDARGGNLHAHHIEHLSTLIRYHMAHYEGELVSAAGRFEFVRWLTSETKVASIENGVTVCEECHWKRHENEGWNYHRPKKRA